MFLKFKLSSLLFEFTIEDRIISLYVVYGERAFSYEKYFPKYFKCSVCGEKVEYEDQKLKVCDEHYEDCLAYFRKNDE